MERNVKALGLGVITISRPTLNFGLYFALSKAMRDQHVNQRHRFFHASIFVPDKNVKVTACQLGFNL